MKPSRSVSALRTAGSSVTERARRYAAPARRTNPGGASALRRGWQRGERRSPAADGAKPPRTSRAVVRRIEPLPVLKVSVLFYLSLCIALFTAGILLWSAAHAVNLVDNVESFMGNVGFTDFTIDGSQMLRGLIIAGGVLVVAGSFANLLMAVLYNLISDVVGGVKVLLAEDRKPPKG